MEHFSNFQVKVKNFKCFSDDEQGFDEFKSINLIIGRNNSGKSSLLDLVEYVTLGQYAIPQSLWNNNIPPLFIAKSLLKEHEVKSVFNEHNSGGGIPGENHWVFGQQFVGVGLEWSIDAQKNKKFISIVPCADGSSPLDRVKDGQNYLQRLVDLIENPLEGKLFRRISAERDIVPEVDSSRNLKVSGDGKGITNIIQNFINKAELNGDLVKETLLNELNVIVGPDSNFTDIICQQLSSNDWEIYLEEETKGPISLSQSGSGLKTIIVVLAYIHLVPAAENKALSEYIFGFEELENNLHPALQRRLLTYLHDRAIESECIFLLTTHSNVEIDFFSRNSDAQIIHVTHDGEKADCKVTKTYIDNRGVLDDLDVRASDLLQSNGIIWVEGPSDRIYLNRWIELWSDGKLSEGNHYQCVFYGGRLLSHLSSEIPDLVEDSVSILSTNKNCIILIDSDNRNQQDILSKTKMRIVTEVENNGGIAWVTRGKEIENYLPANAIKNWLQIDSVREVHQYENFFDHLNTIQEGCGDRFSRKKPLLAGIICPYLTKDNSTSILDLHDRVEQVCDRILQWNNL